MNLDGMLYTVASPWALGRQGLDVSSLQVVGCSLPAGYRATCVAIAGGRRPSTRIGFIDLVKWSPDQIQQYIAGSLQDSSLWDLPQPVSNGADLP